MLYYGAIVKINGTITVSNDDRSFEYNNLHIIGGKFIGSGTQTLRLGNGVTISNTKFEDIKLEDNGESVFINCEFSGDIRLPFESIVYRSRFYNVTQGNEYKINSILDSEISNSSLLRIARIVGSNISNSTIGYENNTSGVHQSLRLEGNYSSNSKYYLASDSIVNSNKFSRSFIDIQDSTSSSIIISNNIFDNVLSGHNDVISITANSASYRQFSITGNTFRVQSSNVSVTVNGDPEGPYYYQTLNISQNSFLNGQQAISYSGSLQIVILNNITKATSIGIASNGGSLRVSGNVEF